MADTSAKPMNGGDGLHSYTHNSTYQVYISTWIQFFFFFFWTDFVTFNLRWGVNLANSMISEAIAELFDVNQFKITSSNHSFSVADLGCSVGPNTFIAVSNIVESIKLKCQSHGVPSEAIEFQAFFNDHNSNDFNTLFKSLPHDRQYFAAGVPGSFHGRLFPDASLHFINSFYALQWLSEVPKEVVDKQSPAWNKGRIYYTNAPTQVMEAYSAQYGTDMKSFFNARAQELVCGGLMALLIPCPAVGILPSHSPIIALADLIGATLLDMAKIGLVSEDKVDSFNFPKYNPTQQELEELIEENGCFRIVKMEALVRDPKMKEAASDIKMFVPHIRAAWEGLIKDNFGSEIIDELFHRFTNKLLETFTLDHTSFEKIAELFVLLQRN
ncbi:loganic acid O-methyltransferase-like [Cornus florida]|uniref:loganic acid O-methyltransferase-like n=1 Tax=Cornus florida TaxID=4283 RepID=UPI00289E181E|nr:loganic acid O-methyltransferase-like [Cornus florida]